MKIRSVVYTQREVVKHYLTGAGKDRVRCLKTVLNRTMQLGFSPLTYINLICQWLFPRQPEHRLIHRNRNGWPVASVTKVGVTRPMRQLMVSLFSPKKLTTVLVIVVEWPFFVLTFFRSTDYCHHSHPRSPHFQVIVCPVFLKIQPQQIFWLSLGCHHPGWCHLER